MASVGHDSIIAKSEVSIFDRAGLPKVDLQNISFKIDSQLVFTDVEKVIALSDVHGQFGILNQPLLVKKVIDYNNHWKYGKEHLVTVGDNLDRGDQVLEILWFLFFFTKRSRRNRASTNTGEFSEEFSGTESIPTPVFDV